MRLLYNTVKLRELIFSYQTIGMYIKLIYRREDEWKNLKTHAQNTRICIINEMNNLLFISSFSFAIAFWRITSINNHYELENIPNQNKLSKLYKQQKISHKENEYEEFSNRRRSISNSKTLKEHQIETEEERCYELD